MREIKFRAWDSEKSQMVSVYAIDWAGTDPMRPTSINYTHKASCTTRQKTFGGAIKLMQYTGHNDKNGVEIYEGDIVAYYSNQSQRAPHKIIMVEWVNRHMGIGFNISGKKNTASGSYYEVIGNIYENPELLS